MPAIRFDPAAPLSGALTPPPDKSISHRAALIAALSDGPVEIANYLRAADTISTAAAVHELGATIETHEARESGADMMIAGVGLRGAREHPEPIEVGNAGTLMRLLPGWLAGQGHGRWTLDGDDSIRRRPMERIAEPLRQMGAEIECREGRFAPLVVTGSALSGIEYELPVASAQVKSCLLLAGLLADGPTTVIEPLPTRDHTEIMLAAAGARVTRGANRVTIEPAERIALESIAVPGDFSSAAFFVVAATLVGGSQLLIEGVNLNPTRTGLLDVMERMGAAIDLGARRDSGGEPVGDLDVRHAQLRGTEVGAAEVPALIDELPLVALLGVFAAGRTVVTGAQELRHKESDRIATVVEGLKGLGAQIEATEDGFVIEGSGGLAGGAIDSHGDHRLAMLGAVAGLASQDGVEVRDFAAAAVSYPGFLGDLESVG